MSFEPQVQVQHQSALLAMLHGRLPQGVGVFDAELRLIYANDGWSSFLECTGAPSSDPPPGTRADNLLPAIDGLRDSVRRCALTGETIQLAGQRCPTATHETFWDITLAPVMAGDDVTGLICVVEEVTERVLAERAAAAKARLAAFRVDVSQALASSDDVDAVLQACAEAMVHHAPAAFARIWVLDEAEDIYRLRASAGLYTRLNGRYSRIPVDWIRQKTFRVYEPGLRIDLLRTHDVREPEWAAEQGLVAWANHPLVVRDRIVGFMAMFARQNFDDDTLSELAAVADAIAQFLERGHAESALREREVQFRGVFEAAADGLIISDPESGQLLEANPAVCAMHGYTHDELMRLDRDDLVHPDARGRLHDDAATVGTDQASRLRLRHLRKDGSSFPAAIQASPIHYRGRPAVLSMVRDVTQEQEDQERLEQRVTERTLELSLLLDVSRNVATTLDLEPLLGRILDNVRAVAEYHGAGILIVEGDHLVQVAGRGPVPELILEGISLPIANAGPIERVLVTGEPLVIPDVWGDDETARGYRHAVDETWLRARSYIRSWLGVPLRFRRRSLGILVVTYDEPNHFTAHHVRLLTAIAAQAAVAIENAQPVSMAREAAALEERQRLARDLHDAVTQTLFSASLVGDVLPTLWARNPQRGDEALQDLRFLTRGALAEMRTLLFELRPTALTEAPLGELLRHLADAVTGRTRLPVVVSAEDVPVLPPDVQIACYRIAQEALNNVAKHAEATQVGLTVAGRPDGTIELCVRDDGRGFESGTIPLGHFGMATMRERATAIGADLTVTSMAGAGTEVCLVWPGLSATTGSMIAAEEN